MDGWFHYGLGWLALACMLVVDGRQVIARSFAVGAFAGGALALAMGLIVIGSLLGAVGFGVVGWAWEQEEKWEQARRERKG